MNTKIYSLLFSSAQRIKYGLGISNFGAMKKKIKRFFLSKYYKKKYSEDDIIKVMKTMGMTSGSNVFIHSSMTEFYNFSGTAEGLINRILNTIGTSGTLIMPAYPPQNLKEDASGVIFDVKNTKSGAGYLTEVFRLYPGVKRSINLQHSVCAYGPLSDYLINEHHLSETAWDKKSPYYKLTKCNTLIFSFGLPYFLGTVIHCTDSLLKDKYKYFSLFFKKKVIYKYRDENGNIGEHCQYSNDFARKRSKKKIVKKYFDKKEFHVHKLSNLRIEMVNAKYTLDLYMDLANRGITMYSVPNPKPYLDSENKFILID